MSDEKLKAGAEAPATLEEALALIDSLKSELEELNAAKVEVKEAPKADGLPKVSIAKGAHKGEYQITAAKVIIPGIAGVVTAEQLASDPAMVEELIKIESGVIQKIK